MQAVILAAGKGSRLHPITILRSKAMLPVLGKPIVERVMENLASCGLRNFILVVNPQDREIREHFQRDSKLDVNLHFVDQPDRLGMADALKHAAPLISEDFVLSACDYLVTEEDVQNLISSWAKRPGLGALLSLIRIPMEDTGKTAIVTLEGDQVTSIVEKPAPDQARSNISSLPLYCFPPRVLDYLTRVQLTQRGEYELQEAIQMMIAADEDVRGLFFKSYHTLTTAEDLLELNLYSLKSDVGEPQIVPDAVGPGTNLVSPLHIEQGTVIGSGCTIGPNVYMEGNVRIGDHVRLENVVVLRQAVIPDRAELSDQVII